MKSFIFLMYATLVFQIKKNERKKIREKKKRKKQTVKVYVLIFDLSDF